MVWHMHIIHLLVVTLAGYCVHSTLVPAIVPILEFAPSDKIHVKKNYFCPMVGGALERGEREVHDRLQKHHHPFVRRFFFESPAPTPLQTTFFCPLSVTFLALVGYCSAVPLQLGADSDRAPCPAPVACVCHLSTHHISRFFPSPI